MAVRHGARPFAEQLEYFRQKVSLPTGGWTDVYSGEHDLAFMVAGIQRMDVLQDLRTAIDNAKQQGTTLAAFRQSLQDSHAEKGWAFPGDFNRRSRLVFDTNLRSSYAAGREAQMADPELRKRRPYGLYRHGGSREPREHHLAWDSLVLPLDDPWWEQHSPTNGWGCKCKKFMLSERDVQRMGLTVSRRAPDTVYETRTVGTRSGHPRSVRVPTGIDPGFEHRPGDRIRTLTPEQRELSITELLQGIVRRRGYTAPDALPAARPFAADRLLPGGLPDEEYIARFLSEFGATRERPSVYRDVTGEALAISDALFRDRATGGLKVTKAGRERALPMLAETIKNPDEIWIAEHVFEGGRTELRRRYLARWDVDGTGERGLGVWQWDGRSWEGVTTFDPKRDSYIERMRAGIRVYRRR